MRASLSILVCIVLSLSVGVAQVVHDPALTVEEVVSLPGRPTTMAFIGPDDTLVLQKDDGKVLRVRNGVLQPAVLDVDVMFDAESGMLGIALDPDFVHSSLVYLFYTEGSGGDSSIGPPLGNRVYRYRWDGAALVEPVLIMDLPATNPRHNGGVLAFGADDKLYVVIGDQNRDGKLENFPSGPDPDDTGVVFRVDGVGRGPRDNPFFDSGDSTNPLNRYWGYGVRNSFGMGFDPFTGNLWITENGTNTLDEITHAVSGFNGGWEQILGPDSRDPQGTADLWMTPGASYRDPDFSWLKVVVPTALQFVGSRRMGCDNEGDMLVGSAAGVAGAGSIFRFELSPDRSSLVFQDPGLLDRVADSDPEMQEIFLLDQFGAVIDVKNGPDGFVYFTTMFPHKLYRLRPSGGFPDEDGDGVDDGCDCDSGDATAFKEPAEIPWLRLSGRVPSLGWDSQSATAGSGTTYSVVSGFLSDLASGGFSLACTLESGLAGPPAADSRPDPAPGQGYYYLIRATNSCASGTFGEGTTEPDPRDVLDVFAPSPCR